ncbi:MAG: cation:proton antiporter [Deltaproteobacteria bacterium]|nr:cation:proton antiporter [Deltaproteobacteria bacterium]
MLITFVAASVLGVVLFLISQRLKISAIVLLLIAGILSGPEFLGIIQPESLGEGLNTIISLSVAIILFEGGLTLDATGYRQVSSEIWGVLTRGVLITWGLSALAIKVLFGFDIMLCLLSASLIIVTGPTVIGPLLQRIRVKKSLHNILYWEGVLIDPIGVFIALLCYEWILSAGEPEAYLNFFSRFFVGAVMGLAFGYIIFHILRKNWIPEERLNFFVLASALLNYTIADGMATESGLLSVTIQGFLLGYKETPQLDKIIEYKVELKDFLIGLLFMLLAANLTTEKFLNYGTTLITVVVIVMFIIRPVNIFLSTWGSTLKVREKLFLSWIAPRGIVAASMSSLFAFHLKDKNFLHADFLESFTYAVIAGTVIFQGFTAKHVGKMLGVLEPRPRGWLIVGAHKLARAVAKFIQDNGESVVLLDTNPREVKVAKREGITALCENAMTIDPAQHVELYAIGNVLAITENEDLNHLLCRRWQKLLGRSRLYYWGYGNSSLVKPGTGPRKGKAIWTNFDIRTILAENVEQDTLITCTSIDRLPAPAREGQILMCKYGSIFAPEMPQDYAGEALFLTLRPTSSLLDFTNEEWIIFSKDKTLEALYHNMLVLVKPQYPDLQLSSLMKDLLAREKDFSSAIGHGISLPHTYTDQLDESILILARVDPPIICPHDETRISLVFMVLSPHDRPEEHLTQISRIAKFVMSEETREALLKAQNRREIYRLLQRG